MESLENKILGYKPQTYCSSSEEEDVADISDSKNNGILKPYEYLGTSQQTGPKGVIEDFKDYENYKKEQKAMKEKLLMKTVKKTALTSLSLNDEEKLAAEEAKINTKIEEEMNDEDKEFFEQYKKKKIHEMLTKLTNMPKFQELYYIQNGNEFLNAIDKHSNVTVVMFIYKNNDIVCEKIIDLLKLFAQKYPHVKFCCVSSSVSGISRNFSLNGVPAMLIYRNGALIGNFVRIHDNLTPNFGFDELSNFFRENDILITFENP